MWVKGTRSWCLLVEYVKDNYFARFHDHSYNEVIKWQNQQQMALSRVGYVR